jgi:hypothetical protein
MGKLGIPVLTLMLGFMVGFGVANRGKSGTEEMNATNALRSQVNSLQSQLRTMTSENTSQVQALTQAKDTCEAKFQRGTILYDGMIFKGRRWLIPADIEPVLLGAAGQADYTHVDPKTQMETMHLAPKQQ